MTDQNDDMLEPIEAEEVDAAPPTAPRVRPRVGVVLGLTAILALDVTAAVGVPFAWSTLPPSPTRNVELAARMRRPLPSNPVDLPPPSDPEALLQISAEDAEARNAAIPVSTGSNPAAEAFRLTTDEISRLRSVDCLTAAVYYEAGLEPTAGQQAVAQVVLNRVRHPAYPNSVCGVVFQGSQRRTGCQFTFTCDGALRRQAPPALWERARRVAEAALSGYVYAPVGLATHYHANYVFPYWAPTLTKVATIGAHIFYRWGPSGRLPGGYQDRYAGVEPNINWRGGAVMANANGIPVDPRDAAAMEAARQQAQQQGGHSMDSFQSAVLRRYEPLQSDSANRIIQERMQAQQAQAGATAEQPSASNRWALTGQSSARPQAPLGRTEPGAAQQPVDLGGVRRRPGNDAPAVAPTTPAQGTTTR